MTLGDVFLAAAARSQKTLGELLPALLFGEVSAERFPHQGRDRSTPALRQRLEVALHSLVNEDRSSLHMTYSSIRAPKLVTG